jgi:MFS family permease
MATKSPAYDLVTGLAAAAERRVSAWRPGFSSAASAVLARPHNQIRLLFLSNLGVLIIGMGLFPVLPLHAAGLGASSTAVGVLFSLMYAANAAGHMLSDRLARRLSRRQLYILVTALALPALPLLGYATAIWQVMILAGGLWFSGGLAMSLTGVWTAGQVSREKRGAAFGLLGLAFPLGAVLGGLAVGQLLAHWDFRVMYVALTPVWLAVPALGLVLRPASPAAGRARQAQAAPAAGGYQAAFYMLVGAAVLSAVGIGMAQLGRSLVMQANGFAASAVAGTATLAGLAAMPASWGLGVLSDRLGRSRLLALTYLLAGIGAAMMVSAGQWWQFAAATAMATIAQASARGLASALAADLLPPESLARGLPVLNSTGALAGIVSFIGLGVAIERLGPAAMYLAVAGLVAAAAMQLLLRPRAAAPAETQAVEPAPPAPEVVWRGC